MTMSLLSKRSRLPPTRLPGLTHRCTIYSERGEVEVYITVSPDERGMPRELFLRGDDDVHALDPWAVSISVLLQLDDDVLETVRFIAEKFSFVKHEPSGRTDNPRIPNARGIVDYVSRWLAMTYLPPGESESFGILPEGGVQKGTDEPKVYG